MINWFSDIDSKFALCPGDSISYTYQLQESAISVLTDYITVLETASVQEYTAYTDDQTQFNVLVKSYPSASKTCITSVKSQYGPDVTHSAFLQCTDNLNTNGAKGSVTILNSLNNDLLGQCQSIKVHLINYLLEN